MEPEELARMLSDLARCGTESRWTIEALADALAGVHYEEGADAVVDFMFRALLAYTPSDTPKGGPCLAS
jgi:hypothetical protein